MAFDLPVELLREGSTARRYYHTHPRQLGLYCVLNELCVYFAS